MKMFIAFLLQSSRAPRLSVACVAPAFRLDRVPVAIDPMEPVRGSGAEDEPASLFSDSSPGPDAKRDEAATPSSPHLAPRDVGAEQQTPWLPTYTPLLLIIVGAPTTPVVRSTDSDEPTQEIGGIVEIPHMPFEYR